MHSGVAVFMLAGMFAPIVAGALVQTPTAPNTSTDRNVNEPGSEAPSTARAVVVPANVQWTNTGLTVSKGQSLRFESSGEIRLSFDGGDVAGVAGAASHRFAQNAPIPKVHAGALIGRVGNGRPFSIGDATRVFSMPSNGRLYLGVNDDHVPDNSGNFVVRVWEP